jgi:hypothetical protein
MCTNNCEDTEFSILSSGTLYNSLVRLMKRKLLSYSTLFYIYCDTLWTQSNDSVDIIVHNILSL